MDPISAYIAKQPSPQKEICKKLRALILKTFPNIQEEQKWGVPVYDGGSFYIGAVKHGVNLGFSVEKLSEEKAALFSGRGKHMRHVKILSVKDIDEQYIAKLLRIVKAQ
jgi:hypothetical protein